MTEEELHKKKQELMKPDWTENLHHELEEMDPNDAKRIVESMTNSEIIHKVNIRTHQEDYIGDYIEYLWEISESAYWRHVIITLDTNVGILWYDIMDHFRRMCNYKIPKEVLDAVLSYAINSEKNSDQDLDAIGGVIKAQIDKFGRIEEIKTFISSLNENIREFASERIFELAKQKCSYDFR